MKDDQNLYRDTKMPFKKLADVKQNGEPAGFGEKEHGNQEDHRKYK
jgi:hypothetical protein